MKYEHKIEIFCFAVSIRNALENSSKKVSYTKKQKAVKLGTAKPL